MADFKRERSYSDLVARGISRRSRIKSSFLSPSRFGWHRSDGTRKNLRCAFRVLAAFSALAKSLARSSARRTGRWTGQRPTLQVPGHLGGATMQPITTIGLPIASVCHRRFSEQFCSVAVIDRAYVRDLASVRAAQKTATYRILRFPQLAA
jgi:hypothetical protein